MSLDTAFIGDVTPWHPEISIFCPFAELEPEAPQVFTATKVLRFHNWLTVFHDLTYVFERNPAGSLEIHHILNKGSYSEGSNDALFRSTALEELKLVLPEWAKRYNKYSRITNLAGLFKEQMIDFLRENGEIWGGNVPVVTIEEWAELEKL
jgi:hypothetical protein